MSVRKPPSVRVARACTCIAAVLVLATPALAQQPSAALSVCGSLENAHGPFDYRTVDRDALNLVERPHFPPVVEALIRGNSGYLGGDLDYTLRAFPNHHRALLSVMRYGEKLKTPQPHDLRYPVECYFDRALRFRPDDSIVRMIYAKFLARNQRGDEADKQLSAASEGAKDNGLTHYNIGLIYLELEQFDKAVAQAHKARILGFVSPELQQRLEAAGKWIEPNAAQPSVSPAASAPRSHSTFR